MTKTTLRGNWPGLPKAKVLPPLPPGIKMVAEPFKALVKPPPERHRTAPNNSMYKPVIDRLLDAEPGTLSAHCPSLEYARALKTAMRRRLVSEGMQHLRPASNMTRVWLVHRDDE